MAKKKNRRPTRRVILPGYSRRKAARRARAVSDTAGGLVFPLAEHTVDFAGRMAVKLGRGISSVAGAATASRRHRKAAAGKGRAGQASGVTVVSDNNPFQPVDMGGTRRVSFRDVVGLDNVKEEIRDRIIIPLRHQVQAKALGITSFGGNCLLVGPGGNGKSLIAHAMANELGMTVFEVTTSSIIRSSQQGSVERVDMLFDAIARYPRVLVVMNEAEGILRDTESPILQAVNSEWLTRSSGHISGSGSKNIIVMVGTSNKPAMFRPAMRRSGRFSMIFVGLPDMECRTELFRNALEGKPSEGLDIMYLASKTRLASCADIADANDGMVQRALRRTLTRDMRARYALFNHFVLGKPFPSSWDREKKARYLGHFFPSGAPSESMIADIRGLGALSDEEKRIIFDKLLSQKPLPLRMEDFLPLLDNFKPSVEEKDLKEWYSDGRLEELT